MRSPFTLWDPTAVDARETRSRLQEPAVESHETSSRLQEQAVESHEISSHLQEPAVGGQGGVLKVSSSHDLSNGSLRAPTVLQTARHSLATHFDA